MARTELSSPLGLSAEFSHLLNKAIALEKESLEKPIMRLMKVNKYNEETARMLRVEFLRFCVLKYHNPDQIFPLQRRLIHSGMRLSCIPWIITISARNTSEPTCITRPCTVLI